MVPERSSRKFDTLETTEPSVTRDSDGVPTKSQILEDIQEGYLYVKSGGKGQPVDEMHREIAEELAREELEKNADIRL